jgi:hypothetical protein
VNRTTFASIALFAAIAGMPVIANGQVRRSAAPDGAAPPGDGGVPRGMPRSERHPYAGVWNGTFTIREPIPVVMVFDVDSARSAYSGFTILPNGGRAPHLESTVARGEMRWKQQNSGGGFWVYTGRFVGRDSVVGTVVLTDWPQLPAGEKPPTGTFAVARRLPGA